MPKEMIGRHNKGIWKITVFFTVLVGLAFLLNGLVHDFQNREFSLATLALGGVVALLGSLLVFTTLLDALGLSDKTQALGMPEGSVRAMLALALLGLFAILASSVLIQPDQRKSAGLQAADVTALIKNNPDAHDIVQIAEPAAAGGSQPTTYTVTFTSPRQLSDSAKQMLTLVGTLMTAVISFYFGTASARAPPHWVSGTLSCGKLRPHSEHPE